MYSFVHLSNKHLWLGTVLSRGHMDGKDIPALNGLPVYGSTDTKKSIALKKTKIKRRVFLKNSGMFLEESFPGDI